MVTKLNADMVSEKVGKFLLKELHLSEKNLDNSTQLNILGADSLTLVKIILYIEKEFKVIVPDSELTEKNFKDVESVTNCIIKNYEK